MKKTWETPKASVQEFEANEYVAACWGVACSVDKANMIEKNMNNYNPPHLCHSIDHCGQKANQVIFDYDNNGTADRMIETGTDGLNDLSCTIFTDNKYKNQRNVSSVKSGETIYWTTSAGSKIWHHVGTVYETVPGHPNRS